MLRSLTAKQFADWERYARLEPFGEMRADYRAASIAQMIHNINAKKGRPLQDFLLKFEQDAPVKWDGLLVAKMICASYSATDKDL